MLKKRRTTKRVRSNRAESAQGLLSEYWQASPSERLNIIARLGQLKAAEAVPLLRKAALGKSLNHHAVNALGQIGGLQAEKALLELSELWLKDSWLNSGRYMFMKQEEVAFARDIIRNLGLIESSQAAPKLVQVLEAGKGSQILAESAARALGRIEDPGAGLPLLKASIYHSELAKSSSHNAIVSAALSSLNQLAEKHIKQSSVEASAWQKFKDLFSVLPAQKRWLVHFLFASQPNLRKHVVLAQEGQREELDYLLHLRNDIKDHSLKAIVEVLAPSLLGGKPR